MQQYSSKVYFCQSEIQNILNEYGAEIRNKDSLYTDKIPYDCYRRMRDSLKGIWVCVDSKDNIYFYEYGVEEEFEYIDINGATRNHLATVCHSKSNPLIMCMNIMVDFANFFYTNYLKYHIDYIPLVKEKEEEKEMATTLNSANWSVNTASTEAWGMDSTSVRTTTDMTTNDWYLTYDNNHYNNDTWSFTMENVSISDMLKELADSAQKTAGAINDIGEGISKINKKEKEKDKMKGFNFDFGPCTNDNVKMSMYGIAVKNQAGEWVSYNPATSQIVNVDIFSFDGGKFMFKMPVAPSKVVKGDVIIHNKKAMIVLDTDVNGFVVVDPHAGEEKKVVPTSNCFGFNFVTKIVSMFDVSAVAPNADAPFGNMLPLMMMMDEDKDIDPMMMMFMMNQNGDMGDMFNNPMMMYLLCGDKVKNDSMLPLMLMMNQSK